MTMHDLPLVNATLNGTSAALLSVAYVLIKNNRVRAHAAVMIGALVTSAAFLTCYLLYHAYRVRQGIGVTHFPASSWKPVYLAILTSHTILAVVILPLIAVTVWMAYNRRWAAHRRVSVVTLPLWFYVSVTGVVVYWMLYRLAPTLAH